MSLKCLLACLPVEESQQPTWPQDRHSRRATQNVPSVGHSSQASGVLCGGKSSGLNPDKCSHGWVIGSSDLKCQCTHRRSVHCSASSRLSQRPFCIFLLAPENVALATLIN